jgi:hypothetical protein
VYHIISALLGVGLLHLVGKQSGVQVAMIVPVFGAVFRVIGHVKEELPPGVGNPVEDKETGEPCRSHSKFVDQAEVSCATFAGLATIGFTVGVAAEFMAGLPWRLPPVQVFYIVDHLLGCHRGIGAFQDCQNEAEAVRQHGWRKGPTTAWMCEGIYDSGASKGDPESGHVDNVMAENSSETDQVDNVTAKTVLKSPLMWM